MPEDGARGCRAAGLQRFSRSVLAGAADRTQERSVAHAHAGAGTEPQRPAPRRAGDAAASGGDGRGDDVETNDDFRFVRALPAWADFEAKLKGLPPPDKPVPTTPSTTAPAPAPSTAAKPADAPAAAKRDKSAWKGSKEDPPKPEPPKPEPPKEEPSAAEPPKAAGARSASAARTGPLVFSAPGLTAVGLGYDAVSGRFIVGDRKDRRLLVVGERSGRGASLAGVDAGFDEVSAFEIDAAEGDLWVTSASSQSRTSTLHKLQLISGRVLTSIALPAAEGPSRFSDVAVTPQNILVLDAEGRRVSRAAKKGRALDLVAHIAVPDCTEYRSRPGRNCLCVLRPRHHPSRSRDSRPDSCRGRRRRRSCRCAVDTLAPWIARGDSGRDKRPFPATPRPP